MKELEYRQIYLGCDPEFFFTKNGEVCGSEKVISETGLVSGSYTIKSKIVRDGVQAELNPSPNTCRANLGNEISRCFRELYQKIKDDKELSLDFSQIVKVSKKELESLSAKSREFGCAPSNNIYKGESTKIKVNGDTYKYRLAGGHIHLGRFVGNWEQASMYNKVNKAIDDPKRLVPLLDILLGNTCVMMDKDPNAKKRRKLYGKAGEYRTPPHGLEYRTLSNFWLQSYQLFSFVTGMARLSVLILANSIEGSDELEKSITSKVKMSKITKAINNNDYELAYENYCKIEQSILEMTKKKTDYPINQDTYKEFKHFITKPLNYWFKENPLESWMKLPDGHGRGWESFSRDQIKHDMDRSSVAVATMA